MCNIFFNFLLRILLYFFNFAYYNFVRHASSHNGVINKAIIWKILKGFLSEVINVFKLGLLRKTFLFTVI